MGRYDDTDTVDITSDSDELDAPPTPTAAGTDERERNSPAVIAAAGRVIQRGWGAADKAIAKDSPFAQRLKLDASPVLIKFDEDEPYASYHQHWIERSGQKSFTCIQSIDPMGCPLCDAGNRPSARFSFNVILLLKGESPVRRSFDVGPRVFDQLKGYHTNPAQGPLGKHYWAASMTGKKASSATSLMLVKERDIAEDWDGYVALTDEVLLSMKSTAYTEKIIGLTPRKVMQGVAAEELGAD